MEGNNTTNLLQNTVPSPYLVRTLQADVFDVIMFLNQIHNGTMTDSLFIYVCPALCRNGSGLALKGNLQEATSLKRAVYLLPTQTE